MVVSPFLPRSLGALKSEGGRSQGQGPLFLGGPKKISRRAKAAWRQMFFGGTWNPEGGASRSRGPQLGRARELPRSCAREKRERTGNCKSDAIWIGLLGGTRVRFTGTLPFTGVEGDWIAEQRIGQIQSAVARRRKVGSLTRQGCTGILALGASPCRCSRRFTVLREPWSTSGATRSARSLIRVKKACPETWVPTTYSFSVSALLSTVFSTVRRRNWPSRSDGTNIELSRIRES
jgi:hypothetical protein